MPPENNGGVRTFMNYFYIREKNGGHYQRTNIFLQQTGFKAEKAQLF